MESVFPNDIYIEILKHLKCSEQGKIRRTCKTICNLPIVNDDRDLFIDKICKPTLNQILDYIYSKFMKDYGTLTGTNLVFVHEKPKCGQRKIILTVRQYDVYATIHKRVFSHSRYGKSRYKNIKSSNPISKQDAATCLESYKLNQHYSSGIVVIDPYSMEENIYRKIFRRNVSIMFGHKC